jgi:hypothetical protein
MGFRRKHTTVTIRSVSAGRRIKIRRGVDTGFVSRPAPALAETAAACISSTACQLPETEDIR